MIRKARLLAAGLLAASAVTPVAAAARPAGTPPNIIVILADDLGYGDLGVQGGRDVRTPRIDQLARQGVRMTHFYSSAPVCGPSRAALMTGRQQNRFGFENNMGAEQRTDPTAG
ncbi:MAG: sulfatase, partial [Novosphingobium sp.]